MEKGKQTLLLIRSSQFWHCHTDTSREWSTQST